MKKIQCAERHDWKQTAESLGFMFHTIDGEPYWDERAYYQFTLKQIEDDLEDPTNELHEMCMDLVSRVVQSEELLERLSIPAPYFDLVRTSWLEGHPHLYGRMDFSYNGNGPAKLLELNYDTPTSLYEAAAFQWGWLEQCIERGLLPAHVDQFNSIDTKLHQAFAQLQLTKPFYFASMKDSVEDKGTTDYLRLIAEKSASSRGTSTSKTSASTAKGVSSTWRNAGFPTCSSCTPGNSSSTNRSARRLPRATRSFSSRPGSRSSPTKASCRCCGSSTKATRTCSRRRWTATRAKRCPRAGCASRTFPGKGRTSSYRPLTV